MLSNGRSKDNLHQGTTKIASGDFEVDGLVVIGDQSATGNGYILPASKGTEGQVLTMNANKTTSFQDAVGGGDNVLGVGNGADITIPYAPSTAPVVNVIPPSFIGTRRVNISNIPVGGSVHFYVNSRYNLQIPSAGSTDTYTNILFFVTGFRADNSSVGACVPTIRNNNYFSGAISVPADLVGYLKVEGVITRTATDTFKATVTAFNRRYADSLNPCQIWENVASIEEFNFPAPQDDDYIQWQLQFFNSYYTTGTFVLTNPSVYWTLKNVSTAITPPVSTSDHTQLTNLSLGDAGHTQFALLGGRSGGGQVLSGGITPAETLTLKSHTVGLPNVIIRNLNTSFEKNIDMNNNDIINVTRIEGNTGQDMVLYSDDGITVAARDPMIINALDGDGIICQTSSNTRMVVTSTELDTRVPINMNSNDINNVANINIDDNGRIENNNNGYSLRNSRDGPTDNIFIAPTENIFFKALNLQSGVNIIFPFANNQIGHPFIGQKLQALWVNSINGFTPFGGLFSGTSDSPTLSASTAEQSILPTTFVGTTLVPPNGFSNADSFHCVLAGSFGSHNGDTLTIRLKGGATSTTLLATLVVPLNNSSSSSFEIEIDFQIRNIGGAGVADIVINFDFTYNQSGGGGAFVGERGVFQNNTTFDTTLTNILEITAQFSSNNANNTIKTIVSKLSKDF